LKFARPTFTVGLAITFYPIKLEGDDLEKLSTTTTGLVVGAIMGAMHLLWSVLVAAGWGQPTMNLIFWMYFIKPVNLIEPFESIRMEPASGADRPPIRAPNGSPHYQGLIDKHWAYQYLVRGDGPPGSD
jgi:hypothetical protein